MESSSDMVTGWLRCFVGAPAAGWQGSGGMGAMGQYAGR